MPNLSVQNMSVPVVLGFLGVVCLLAAVVGGGLKLFGIELPVLNSKRRQIILAGFGVVLIAACLVWVLPPWTPTPKQSQERPLDFTGPNAILFPAAAAVDSNDNLYVADHDNNRVMKLRAGQTTPNEMKQFSGPNSLYWPSGLAVDSASNLYVTDSRHNRVLKLPPGLDSTPTPMSQFDGLLDGPLGVAVDNHNAVYVADTGHRQVLKLAADSSTPITLAFTEPHLLNPAGLAVDSNDNVYVTDPDALRVYEWSNTGQQTEIFSRAGLRGPRDVAVDKAGSVYVTDVGNQVLKVAADSTTPTPVTFADPPPRRPHRCGGGQQLQRICHQLGQRPCAEAVARARALIHSLWEPIAHSSRLTS
jgi:DNA-binding beta-propeller fold protein YncE